MPVKKQEITKTYGNISLAHILLSLSRACGESREKIVKGENLSKEPMKRIIFLLIIFIFSQQGLVQAVTLETVMVVKSILGDDYGEIVLVDSHHGKWRVNNPTIEKLNIGDALRVEVEIEGREVVDCVVMEKLNEYFDEETNLEVLMRVGRNKKGQRVLFDSDKNEWQLRLPRWAVVGSLVLVDVVVKNKKVIKWRPKTNLGYGGNRSLSP